MSAAWRFFSSSRRLFSKIVSITSVQTSIGCQYLMPSPPSICIYSYHVNIGNANGPPPPLPGAEAMIYLLVPVVCFLITLKMSSGTTVVYMHFFVQQRIRTYKVCSFSDWRSMSAMCWSNTAAYRYALIYILVIGDNVARPQYLQ